MEEFKYEPIDMNGEKISVPADFLMSLIGVFFANYMQIAKQLKYPESAIYGDIACCAEELGFVEETHLN